LLHLGWLAVSMSLCKNIRFLQIVSLYTHRRQKNTDM
jgi:hypothetical protein